jgi:tape measure domain-containing protein
MSVQIGSMFAALSLDTVAFVRGTGRADKAFGTMAESIRRSASGSAKSIDGLNRAFGSAGFGAGSRAFAGLNEQARMLPVSIRTATAALAGLGGVFGGSALLRGLDSFNSIQNALRSVSGGAGSTGAQFSVLLQIAERSRASLESTVTLFARLSKAAPELGFERTARAVETVSKALALGGATAEEAASAAIQFSQAIGSGVLQGDELRAVLESPLGNALAKGLKLTTAEMRKLGSEGKLTAGVVLKALDDIGPGIDKQFAGSVRTIGQAFAGLQNQIIAAIGKLDQEFGASRIIGDGIAGIAIGLDTVTRAAEAAGVALAAVSVGRIGGGGVTALGASLRALGTDAAAGVAQATGALGTLEQALERAIQERSKLNGFTGPLSPKSAAGFDAALQLNNKRIAELASVLPQARTQLAAAQKAASGFGIALAGARGIGGSLVAFLGGPWGVAFAAAAAGATLLGARMARAAQEAQNYKDVSDRLLKSATSTNAKAADTVAVEKYSADLEALRSDAATARREIQRLLTPVVQIASEIDNLRQTGGEFTLFPGAVRTVDFIQKQVDKLATGGTLQQFNDALKAFQSRYQVPAGGTLFEQIADQAAQADKAIQTLSIATDRLREKQAAGPQLSGVQSPEAATDAASFSMSRDRLAKIAAESAVFAGRVDDIKSREQKISDTITAAVTKAGYTVNAGLKQFIDGLAKTQALADQVTVASVAAQQPFTPKQNPNLRFPPGKGPNAALDQGNQAIQLAQLIQQANQIRELRDKISAERQSIGNTGGLLKSLFGSRADSNEVKGALSGIESDVQRVFDQFSTGKISAVEAFNAIEQIRGKLQQLGAEPAPLDAFLEQISSAITGIPSLSGQIVDLTAKMRALAAAASSVKLPGGAKAVFPPDATKLPGYATGGAFKVGGSGGTDSQLVQFMASPTETVAVLTPSQIRSMNDNRAVAPVAGNSISQSIVINATDAGSMKASRRQIQMDMADAVQAAVNRTR